MGARELSARIDEYPKGHVSPNAVVICYDTDLIDRDDYDRFYNFDFRNEFDTEDGNPAIDFNICTFDYDSKGRCINMKGKMRVELRVAFTDKDWKRIKGKVKNDKK